MGVVIIGSGNWGATLTGLINPSESIRLWCETPEAVESARDTLPTIAGTERASITVETAFNSPLTNDDIVVLVVPSSVIETVARNIKDHCKPPYPILVTAAKGLDRKSFRTMSQVIRDAFPEATVAVISGPNIAKEIRLGRPAKAMIGCSEVNALIRIAKSLQSDRLYLDMTRDTVDLELCAVMKGVFAIGSGVIAGRNWGSNFMGLLLTFGLHEMVEISKFLGISNTHVFGVAGLGDLVATCFSPDSRNYRLGELLATGVSLKEALREVHMVVEGAMTAAAVSEMAALRINVPLFAAIAKVVEDPSDEAFNQFEKILLEYPGSR